MTQPGIKPQSPGPLANTTVYKQSTIEKWTKGCILPFPKKGDLGITKNYRGITLTAIAAKVYNALLLSCIQPKVK